MSKRLPQGISDWLPLKENFANPSGVVPNEFPPLRHRYIRGKRRIRSVPPKSVPPEPVPPESVPPKSVAPNQLMKSERYLVVRQSALLIQRYFRARKQMIEERTRFQTLRTAVITTQRLFRANQLMKVERQKFLQTKNSILLIQRRFRLNKERTAEIAVIRIQSLWRGYTTRKRIHEEKQKVKTAIARILNSTILVTEDRIAIQAIANRMGLK